ncbi:MAG: NAD(P)/FAD-dependent oxidoreductase [Sandaracinaceae bacterium]|nr:NAD(P)/FAD-dependent oxidoreductase [Sandaracinaceae bacterium]
MRGAFDVAIVGGGKAGSLLARQLRRELPDASVVVIEKARERSYKVGESTVDVAGKYLTKRLGLSSYLYQHQLPKNGLRFFFDREDRSGSLEELSEIGSTRLIPFPSFQIDRARFEQDLLQMNAASGADVRIGVRVAGVRHEGGGHVLALEEDGAPSGELRARWLIDASGRSSLLARQKKLRVPSTLENAAVWGRFRGVTDLDDYGGEAFRARVSHTPRMLSTNHFCYPGYWIWLIPLGRGITSVGVVMERALFSDALRTEEGLLAFLRSHRCMQELLRDAETIDVMSFEKLAYGTARFADPRERWALVGEAAAFTDPLYSPGGDFIALENDWVTDLVRRELAGEAAPALDARAALYDRALAVRYASTLRLYEGLYGTLGSFELFASKWDLDQASYLSLWLEPYLLEREVAAQRTILGVLDTFKATFLAAQSELRSRNRFFDKNLGHAVLDPAARWIGEGFGTAASQRRAIPRVRDTFQIVIDELQAKLGHRRSEAPIPFARFASGRALL